MKLIISLVVITGVLLGVVLLSKDTTGQSSPDRNLNMQSVEADINNGGQLLDVRTAEEYAQGHIKGAHNLSLQAISGGSMPAVGKDKPVYVYCQSGNRSAQATKVLKAAGFSNVIDLGAMTNVQKLGGQITT